MTPYYILSINNKHVPVFLFKSKNISFYLKIPKKLTKLEF